MDMSKYRTLFFSESREHLNTMGRLLVELEKNGRDRATIDALFREAHSVKGMAASMGFARTAELAHCLEDMLDHFRRDGAVPVERVDRLLTGIDLLEGLVADLEAERPERDIASFLAVAPEPLAAEIALPVAAERPAAAAVAAEMVAAPARPWQVSLELSAQTPMPAARLLLIYNRLAALGQVAASTPDEDALREGNARFHLKVQLKTEKSDADLGELLAAFPEVAWFKVGRAEASGSRAPSRREERSRTVRVRTELLDQFINLAGEMITNRYRLQGAHRSRDWQDLGGGIDGMARLVTDLHHHVLKVRMMPLESITGNLPRVVRDLARKSGKEVAFAIEGEEIELDRAILEDLADPLVHMVRNAVDHGIETRGRVRVKASREKDMAVLEVSDDGRGIDPEAIRAKAVARGLLTLPQAKALREREVLQLVCRPGFSTAEAVTEISGRGVGMDVVRSAVENLGGNLEIFSRPGAGTCVQLRLPLSVAIIQMLVVECDGRRIGIPLTRVQRLLHLTRDQIQSTGKKLVIRLDEEVVPLLSLRKILGLSVNPLKGSIPVVVSEVHGRRVGLVVDALCGQREAFVKALDFPLSQIPGVTGATILGDGRILFIIDPQLLLDDRHLPPLRPAGEAS